MATVQPTWSKAGAYEAWVGRWSRKVAPLFVDWLGLSSGLRWLDIGCGTGALTQAVLDRAEPQAIQGIDPSAGFVEDARLTVVDRRAKFSIGDAMALRFPAGSFDCTVSGLVLNFVPDPHAAMAEARRVTRPGGWLGAYVWDYAGEMQMIRHFWTAAAELHPAAARLDQGASPNLFGHDELLDCFSEAGLDKLAITGIDVDTVFRDFDDYWTPFLGGNGSAPAFVASLSPESQVELRDLLRARLPAAADGSIALLARAWAVRGQSR